MTRKHRRLILVTACLAGLGAATALTLNAISSTIVFFVTPADLAEKPVPEGRTIRLGGLVVPGSISRSSVGGEPVATFKVTDGKAAIPVHFTGVLPDLFREGQGVVALGVLAPDHTFTAQEVLAKHDEKYMPKDVADALKKRGFWKASQAGS
jgi:cytochrome c-type biogenesis protein CcmE